jgi:antitoxin ParD1/3/4
VSGWGWRAHAWVLGFVKHQVSSGRYSNASEIVREALRLLEEQQQERAAKLKYLRQAAKQGFDEIDEGKASS